MVSYPYLYASGIFIVRGMFASIVCYLHYPIGYEIVNMELSFINYYWSEGAYAAIIVKVHRCLSALIIAFWGFDDRWGSLTILIICWLL